MIRVRDCLVHHPHADNHKIDRDRRSENGNAEPFPKQRTYDGAHERRGNHDHGNVDLVPQDSPLCPSSPKADSHGGEPYDQIHARSRTKGELHDPDKDGHPELAATDTD